jgi:glycogen debranching enzyme
MRIRTAFFCVAALLPAFPSAIHAQPPTQPRPPQFNSVSPIAFDTTLPVLRAPAEALKPFTVAGERGVLLGQQDGTFEAWILPVKILSHLTIEAEIEGYSVPIDVNQQSAEIEVRPDRTTITYAHIGFTVRQIMFSPNQGPSGTGPVVLFEFDCLHPTDFTFRFTPNLELMWPSRNEGHPGPEWVAGVADGKPLPGGRNGYYVIHADYPDLAAAITIPNARPGILAPYQERPQTHPVELKLHIDPARDRGKLFPLLMAVGTSPATAANSALAAQLDELNQSMALLYATHADSYKSMLQKMVTIDTPDKTLNEAFQWAEISIEQLKAKPYVPDPARDPVSAAETALVAGYYASGDSARPGFGWFFGRDALYTLYAVNGFGDFALSKSELEFLIHRQRADGKIMHEYSQTAPSLDWQSFPYMYAAADSTPLFLLAVLDYVRASGDTQFLKDHRDAIEKAYAFLIDPAHDTDHDGIYDNSQGTGWVESWPGGMPHQEIYLALLTQQAADAMSSMEALLGDRLQSGLAKKEALSIARTIESEYYDREKSCYAFSHNPDGSQDRTTTVYPALAWWSGFDSTTQTGATQPGTGSILAHGDECLRQLASHTFNTDWGLRDVSNEEKIYDGMSYHQGSVWPLFTGWAALAEYRGNQPLAGYQMLMENANLTRAQDLGAHTELLSGDFFVPFGRSTSHQLWSSAMVITPTLRGLFGISIDAQSKTITVNPHLPAGWDYAGVRNVPLPDGQSAAIDLSRVGDHLELSLATEGNTAWKLRSDFSGATDGPIGNLKAAKMFRTEPFKGLRIPIPALEIDPVFTHLNPIDGVSNNFPDRPPLPGVRTSRFRITHANYADQKLTLTVEGLADTEAFVSLVRHGRFVPEVKLETASAEGGDAKISMRERSDDPRVPALLVFDFPKGTGWQTLTVTLTW